MKAFSGVFFGLAVGVALSLFVGALILCAYFLAEPWSWIAGVSLVLCGVCALVGVAEGGEGSL